jgi:hypothetical protein
MMFQRLTGRFESDEEFLFTWTGLPASRRTLPLLEVAQVVPAFARRPFQLVQGAPRATINPFHEVIVRLATDEEPSEIPVGVVSRSYQLIQHHEILQRAASIMAAFNIDLEKVAVTLDLTIHGERMALGLLFPNDSEYSFEVRKGDVMASYLEFINSVDGSLRLSVRVSWLRLVCTNGLVAREVRMDFSRTHIGDRILEELQAHIQTAVQSMASQRKVLERWTRLTIEKGTFDHWIENTVRATWGLKAAVRAHHITLRGRDVKISKMLRSTPAAQMPTKDVGSVAGALTDSLNVFAISQALTWLAGNRGDLQEQLDWKGQVPEMIAALVPDDDQLALDLP